MKEIFSDREINIFQKNFQQVVLRGKGDEKFNQIINKEISILPPSNNLEIQANEKLFLQNMPSINGIYFICKNKIIKKF